MAKKLIIRGDDLGYSEAFNYGYIEAIRNGMMTSAELMIGMPATEHAVQLIKEFPWIPIGWHIHVFGKPSADPTLVPRLLDEKGWLNLKISKGHPQDETLYDELRIELEAELHRFIELIGRKPDMISNVDDQKDPYSRVLRELAEEYHINHVFRNTQEKTNEYRKWIQKDDGTWKIESIPFVVIPTHGKWPSIDVQAKEYCSEDVLLKNNDEILKEEGVAIAVYHPGYVDGFILDNTTCNAARARDVEALTSKRTRDHLRELGVELLTSTDLLYGTKDYESFERYRENLKV